MSVPGTVRLEEMEPENARLKKLPFNWMHRLPRTPAEWSQTAWALWPLLISAALGIHRSWTALWLATRWVRGRQ